jgi:Ca2+-binding RTX toxin-like protein
MANLALRDFPENSTDVPGFLLLSQYGAATLVSVAPGYVAADLRSLSRQDWTLSFIGTGLGTTGNRVTSGTITALSQDTAAGQRFYLDGLFLPAATFEAYRASGDEAGLLSTILGGDDQILGSSLADVLHAYAGADELQGRDGDDSLYGGAGNDSLYGGTGRDTLFGEAGDDRLFGEADDDTLSGGEGADTLYGGTGADLLKGDAGDDTIYGEAGVDSLYGGAGDDRLFGGVEDDSLYGGAGADTLFGDSGNDLLAGEDGDDTLGGDTGDDVLRGGAGNDRLSGGAGSDRLEGGDGNDVLDGGENPDILLGGTGDDRLIGGGSDDMLDGGEGYDVVQSLHLRRQAFLEVLDGTGGWDYRTSGDDGTDLLADVETIRFVDGWLDLSAEGPVSSVARVYGAGLGRAPDAIGLGFWTAYLEAGHGLQEIAAGIVASTEFAVRYGQPGDRAFVTLLYENVLDRAPDQAGLDFWAGRLASGTDRATVLTGFSESPEYMADSGFPAPGGLWAADPLAVDVLRYYTVALDRLPEAEGLIYWVGQLRSGTPVSTLSASFLGSPEYQATYGGLSDADFVARLYRNTLDRDADAGGQAYWVHQIEAGAISRSGVADSFAFSDEMTAKVATQAADGIALA